MDTNTRTLAKTVTYRLATFVLTYLITMLLTGQQTTSAGIAILSLTAGSLTFIIHERLWTRVKWGNLGGFDRKVRSVIKTITYRLWSLFIVFVLGLFFGLGASEALSVTVVLNIMYLLIHYTNERVWNRVKWGKI